MAGAADERERRLLWRCRRGMKELDLLLTRYLRERWPLAAETERGAFERFLELPDPEIAAYLLGNASPDDADARTLVELLRDGR